LRIRRSPARVLAASAALAAALVFAGCSLGGGIARHSVDYNRTVERATDDVLVLNVLRARDRMPLHFSAIAAIHGSLGLSAGFGYDLSGASVNNVLPAILGTTQPSFDIGPLDRQEFARGLLRPIDPGVFRLLSGSGLQDQMLIHLVVSRFEDAATGRVVRNDPRLRRDLDPEARRACAALGVDAAPPCDPFQAVVDAMTARGRLTFNGYTRLIPVGPALPAAKVSDPDKLLGLREPGLTLRPDGPGRWRLYRPVGQLVLCVPISGGGGDRRTAYALDSEPPQVSPISQEGDPCHTEEVAESPAPAGHPSARGLSWYLRSVNELLHYLGDVQRREQESVPCRVDLGDGRTPRLFRLWEHEPPDARMSVDYGGRRWWVAGHDPAAPGDMTTTVLSLANLLLNLQKSAGELPAAGTLRLVR
jgi:hypothetical protein